MRDHSLEPLKKYLGEHKRHNNKDVQMAFHDRHYKSLINTLTA